MFSRTFDEKQKTEFSNSGKANFQSPFSSLFNLENLIEGTVRPDFHLQRNRNSAAKN